MKLLVRSYLPKLSMLYLSKGCFMLDDCGLGREGLWVLAKG